MKIQLDKTKKIVLLQAIAEGAIETEMLQNWLTTETESLTDEQIISEVVRISESTNHTICRRRVEVCKCPYNQLQNENQAANGAKHRENE